MNTATNAPTVSDINSKPGSIKAIQTLIIIKALLVLVFFVVFTIKDITIGTVGPQIILYTFFAFAILAIPIFYFIKKRNLTALRIVMIVDLLAAIPASAFISIALSLVALGLTFAKTAKSYFNQKVDD